MAEIGPFLIVWIDDYGTLRAQPAAEGEISAKVLQWIERGIDSLVEIPTFSGADHMVRASMISMWRLVTPSIRADEYRVEAQLQAEERAALDWGG